MQRLTRPAPADKWKLWQDQLHGCWIGPTASTPPRSVALCGHDLSLEHAVTEQGHCRACLNAAIIRGAA